MQIPQYKERDHGQRTAKKEQGSKETQEETDTGDLTPALSGSATRRAIAGRSRSSVPARSGPASMRGSAAAQD